MRYLLPAVLVVLLWTMIVLSPHVEPRRLRSRGAAVNKQLLVRHGFSRGSKASWADTAATHLPPFHYGARRALDGEMAGALDDRPVRVAGYECVENGSRHRYGLVHVTLPEPVSRTEVRGEPVFTSARVYEAQLPEGLHSGPTADFNRAFQVYTPDRQAATLLTSPATAAALLTLPERFSWRTGGSQVLVWKRGGWPDAESLVVSVRAVIDLVQRLEATTAAA